MDAIKRAVASTIRSSEFFDLNLKSHRKALKNLFVSYVGVYGKGRYANFSYDVEAGRKYLATGK